MRGFLLPRVKQGSTQSRGEYWRVFMALWGFLWLLLGCVQQPPPPVVVPPPPTPAKPTVRETLPPSPEDKSPVVSEYRTIQVDVGNIRERPSTESRVITRVSRGTEVGILDKRRDWYKVVLKNGQTGWANEILFEKKKAEKPPKDKTTTSMGKDIPGPPPEQPPQPISEGDKVRDDVPPEPSAPGDPPKDHPPTVVTPQGGTKSQEERSTPLQESSEITLVSSDTQVAVFSQPSVLSPKVTSLPAGTKVRKMKQVDDYYQIEYRGITGYVHRDFVAK